MKQKFYPCLWFDGNAKEAATLYCSIFESSSILSDSGMVVNFELIGQKIMGLNGGPHFKLNASISFFVEFESEEKLNEAWQILSEGEW